MEDKNIEKNICRCLKYLMVGWLKSGSEGLGENLQTKKKNKSNLHLSKQTIHKIKHTKQSKLSKSKSLPTVSQYV